MKKKLSFLVIFLLLVKYLSAQVYTNKEVGAKNQTSIDSLKVSEYPYLLPIWGSKVTEKGYNLPYSAGLGVNYIWQESEMVISDLFVGFNNGPMYDLNEVIRFHDAKSSASVFNVRPDVWVLPFLNVYAILAKAKTSTQIDAGVWLPDTSDVWSEYSTLSTKANFDATTFGFGLTPTMGVGGGWLALDMNFTWSDISALDKPVFTYIFGPRLGKTFKFKKPEQNFAFWVGGFRVKFGSETNGSIKLAEVLPVGQLEDKIDQGQAKVEDTQEQVDAWWNNLSPKDQANPVNSAKYETYNRVLDAAGNILTAADGAVSNIETSTVQYSLQKKNKDIWNFVVGSQFQLNKHWMVRAEYGFLASRKQFIGGLQYRFGL